MFQLRVIETLAAPRVMDIESAILKEFSLSSETLLPDSFIEKNDDLMWLEGEIDYLVYVPSYMLWCIRNGEKDGNLVCERTISAIAEFGRCKNSELSHLNFRFLCRDEQRAVVSSFLVWASNNLELCDNEQIKRSIKRW